MGYIFYDLNHLDESNTVEVNLEFDSNIKLMTYENFVSYRWGRSHQFFGGYYSIKQVKLAIPFSANWIVVGDRFGLPFGRIGFTPQVLKQVTEDAAQLLESTAETPTKTSKYDVFISHASEDKDDFVRPLVNTLKEMGISVWYDESNIEVGDLLSRTIGEGLNNSKLGVIVASKKYFEKGWAMKELGVMVNFECSKKMDLLSIWHGVGFKEVSEAAPLIIDSLAVKTNEKSIEEIASLICKKINRNNVLNK